MFTTRRIKSTFPLLLLLVLVAAATVSAADSSAQQSTAGTAPQILDAPPNSDSDHGGDDGGSISAPASGSDAQAIIAGSAHTMGSTDDSTEEDDDAKSGGKGNNQPGGGHHGQCVTGCATKSTAGVGCGDDLSKPACFCKSESFIDQTFACINATCPQQFHGAAGVITSICGVTGEPGIKIPGYQSPSNLENMPTINDDPKSNGTNATSPPAPASGAQGGADKGSAGTTSTFVMPAGMSTGATSDSSNNASGTTLGGGSSGATSVKREAVGVVIAISVIAVTASAGVWTLF